MAGGFSGSPLICFQRWQLLKEKFTHKLTFSHYLLSLADGKSGEDLQSSEFVSILRNE